jgi:hypothetical protein
VELIELASAARQNGHAVFKQVWPSRVMLDVCGAGGEVATMAPRLTQIGISSACKKGDILISSIECDDKIVWCKFTSSKARAWRESLWVGGWVARVAARIAAADWTSDQALVHRIHLATRFLNLGSSRWW